MKFPEIFLPEKKLDNKVEELMKEKPLQNSQSNKDEIPRYAVQENGDYLVMRGGILINTSNCKSITSSTFYFTIDSEEHKLYIGNETMTKLDEKFVSIEEDLVSKLFDLGLLASREPDLLKVPGSDWELEMKHATENIYKKLVKLVNKA